MSASAAPAIRLDGVSKRYWKLEEQAMLLKSLLPFNKPKRSELWALRDVDLSVAPGETLGILGRNGAGKTTLLRLLAGVTRPSTGTLTITGRIAPLISVGVGFHREMSGRENIYVNGMLLGLTHAEIERRFDEIVAFAELGDFIDTPVKFYSSGMFMRLGFSVAIHTDPQVLLVDEILAVGDLAFQAKCFERMRAIQDSGTTIVLVSHSMQAIRMLCERAVVMRHGQVSFDGDVDAAVAHHFELLSVEGDRAGGDDPHAHRVLGGVDLVAHDLLGPDGPAHHVEHDTPLSFRMAVRFQRPVDDPVFNVSVVAEDGTVVYGMRTPIATASGDRRFEPGQVAEIRADFVPRVGEGTYRILSAVHSADARDYLLIDQHGPMFYVGARDCTYGRAELGGTLVVDGERVVDNRDAERVTDQ